MATSGSIDFSLNRNEVITDALILLGVVGADQSISSEDTALASRSLNRMIKHWAAQGIYTWTEQEATIFLVKGQESYSLNATSGDHASNTVVETTLGGAEALGQTILTVTSSAGMTANDNVGIELDDGTRQWTTIASVDSSTQITVNDSLTAAAASGNTVYSYTTKLARPLHINQVRLRDSNAYDTPTLEMGRKDYFAMSDKSSQGRITEYHYDPGLSVGTLYVWPTADNVKDRLKITYTRQIEDMDSGTNDFDFPVEWLDALVYNLALRIAPMFNRIDQINIIAPLAGQFLNEAMMFDHDAQVIRIYPE